jgi:orotate phosphoribosyltransferase
MTGLKQIFMGGLKRTDDHLILDSRELLLNPDVRPFIVTELFKRLQKLDCTAIAGLTMAGQLMASNMIMLGNDEGKNYSGYLVRYQRKSIGLRKLVEGSDRKEERVVLFDDILRTNGHVFQAIDALKERGFAVVGVIALVKYDDAAVSELSARNIPTEYLFTAQELGLR